MPLHSPLIIRSSLVGELDVDSPRIEMGDGNSGRDIHIRFGKGNLVVSSVSAREVDPNPDLVGV